MPTFLEVLSGRQDAKKAQALNETMTYSEYLEKVIQNPSLARSAYQRMYDMIVAGGVEEFKKYHKTQYRYKFFSTGANPIYGLHEPLHQLVSILKGGAGWHGPERRLTLLHGPVGSSKSTICKKLKVGLEEYSTTDVGAIYSFKWVDIPDVVDNTLDIDEEVSCPMFEDPLQLIPEDMRPEVETQLNEAYVDWAKANGMAAHKIRIVGALDPKCKYYMEGLLKANNYDWKAVCDKHIVVYRYTQSEADRRGIGTFQPKDEKNQDSTELTGDINFRKLAEVGRDSDPRAFAYDGEFEIANRGMLETIEILKLASPFLYDYLGACQERQIKPKKSPQISIDTVLIGHTNTPEFKNLISDNKMEALKDRMIKIDIPYLLEWDKELAILVNEYGNGRVPQHIAPHTLEIASLWAILTRLEMVPNEKVTLVQKAELYNGTMLQGWTEDRIREMADDGNEGMVGVSARYVQNKISNALVAYGAKRGYINPFIVLNELEEGLKHYTLINNEDERRKYKVCITFAKEKLEAILKKEVQDALIADDKAIESLYTSYIDNIFAAINGTKIENAYLQKPQDPDEKLMRAIEVKAGIAETYCKDFRRSITTMIASFQREGKVFNWKSDSRLRTALEKKIVEDTKDHIKLSQLSVGAGTVNPELQEKIDIVKNRLIQNYGYNEQSATDVLNYISSIQARGDLEE